MIYVICNMVMHLHVHMHMHLYLYVYMYMYMYIYVCIWQAAVTSGIPDAFRPSADSTRNLLLEDSYPFRALAYKAYQSLYGGVLMRGIL